jgi:hypothetical protein
MVPERIDPPVAEADATVADPSMVANPIGDNTEPPHTTVPVSDMEGAGCSIARARAPGACAVFLALLVLSIRRRAAKYYN